jgi:transcriptional regulator with XRE-family HTH domain
MPARYSRDAISVELLRLLETQPKPMSLRALAAKVDVQQSHLSRVLGAKGARTPSRELLERIAKVLGVPPEHFREYRQLLVIEAIKSDVDLLDRTFAALTKRRH